MGFLINIAISVAASLAALVGAYNYLPLNILGHEAAPKYGTTITTINGTDTLSSSRSVINTNFSNLNTGKFELSTWYATTSATQLTGIGTITTGVWNGTAVNTAYGGTGSTTLSANELFVGNGTSALKSLGWGTSGQALISNGTAAIPTWQSAGVDTTIFYNWTNEHNFTYGLFATNASSTNATTTGLYITGLSAGNVAVNSTGKTYSYATTTGQQATAILTGARPTTNAASYTSLKTLVIPASTFGNNDTMHVTAIFVNSNNTNTIGGELIIGNGSASTTFDAAQSENIESTYNLDMTWQNSATLEQGSWWQSGDATVAFYRALVGASTGLTYSNGANIYVQALCKTVSASDNCILTTFSVTKISP